MLFGFPLLPYNPFLSTLVQSPIVLLAKGKVGEHGKHSSSLRKVRDLYPALSKFLGNVVLPRRKENGSFGSQSLKEKL